MKQLTRIELQDIDYSTFQSTSYIDNKYFMLSKRETKRIQFKILKLKEEWYKLESPCSMTEYIWEELGKKYTEYKEFINEINIEI